MDIDIEKLVKAATEGLDLSNFHGDVVAFKHVENEIGNVEAGGIGVQVYHGDASDPNSDDALVRSLLPIFKNDRKEVAVFIKSISGADATQVTSIVNTFVREDKIVKNDRKGKLWKILNQFGYYDKSDKNWNSQVN